MTAAIHYHPAWGAPPLPKGVQLLSHTPYDVAVIPATMRPERLGLAPLRDAVESEILWFAQAPVLSHNTGPRMTWWTFPDVLALARRHGPPAARTAAAYSSTAYDRHALAGSLLLAFVVAERCGHPASVPLALLALGGGGLADYLAA